MLILSIDEVRPGTKLAMAVMHPQQRSQELLRAGFCLDEAVIDKLKGLGVPQVFVEFPGLDDLDKYLEPFIGPERRSIYSNVKAAITTAERETRPVASYQDYYLATREFIKLLMSRSENRAMLDLLSANNGDGGPDVAHATTVAHLALVIGLKLEAFLIRSRPRLSADKARDVTNLGVAGMLHDLGKCKLREDLRTRSILTAPADGEDKAEYESHPQRAYDLIRNNVEATTAAAVLHHHQRFDGSGFPVTNRGDGVVKVSGNAIHPFARILAAADLFDRLSVAEDGRRRTNFEVLDLIRTHHADWIDPEVMITLPQVLPPFSPGRRVTLSDETQAIVTGFHPKTPYLPSVKRMRMDDLQLDDDTVDLRDQPDLKIIALDGRPLTTVTSPTTAAASPAASPTAAAA